MARQQAFAPFFKLAPQPLVDGQVKATAQELGVLLVEAQEEHKLLRQIHPDKDHVDSLRTFVDWMPIQLQRGPPAGQRTQVRRVTAELRRRQRAFARSQKGWSAVRLSSSTRTNLPPPKPGAMRPAHAGSLRRCCSD